MKKYEDIIKDKAGRENHFRVPTGYFDDFTKRMLAQLPADEVVDAVPQLKTTMNVCHRTPLWKPIVACAASVAAVIFSIFLFNFNSDEDSEAMASNNIENISTQDEYVDDVADFAMMDNADIIACMYGE